MLKKEILLKRRHANISETKDQFFDPNLLSNTQKQIKAKEKGVIAYMEK